MKNTSKFLYDLYFAFNKLANTTSHSYQEENILYVTVSSQIQNLQLKPAWCT